VPFLRVYWVIIDPTRQTEIYSPIRAPHKHDVSAGSKTGAIDAGQHVHVVVSARTGAVDREINLAGQTGRIKNVITDQKIIAGIGNAYSDEILHTAKLSPYATAGRLGPDELDRLHEAMAMVLTDAVLRSVGGQAARLKGEKRTGLRVHARTGLPCPVCGDVVAEVSFADRSFQYCPTCQTGGRKLADRRLSRLVK